LPCYHTSALSSLVSHTSLPKTLLANSQPLSFPLPLFHRSRGSFLLPPSGRAREHRPRARAGLGSRTLKVLVDATGFLPSLLFLEGVHSLILLADRKRVNCFFGLINQSSPLPCIFCPWRILVYGICKSKRKN
jgi:hypothetical protein